MTNSEARTVDASAIVGRGSYEILDDYALREELGGKLRAAFCDGVERFEGRACRRAVEAEGLKSLHRHFPVEKVELLEDYLRGRLREDLYYWSCAVGSRDLRLSHPFYVDYLIVIRIHYPYFVARKGGKAIRPSFPFAEKLRLALAAARDPRLLVHHVAKTYRTRRRRDEQKLVYDAASYHGDLPTAARSHGPHVDTWYGHSYDGINLWLSIDGVNEDNTVILYPEMFGRPVDYDPKSMYLAAGIALPRPVKVRLEPGQLLLFNPEMLHGTQVNISDETRVALTTRINPHQPRFNDDAPFNFEHWLSSVDLERREFGRIRLFAANRHRGKPSTRPCAEAIDSRTRRLTLSAPVPKESDFVLCASDALADGEKLAVDTPNLKLLLVRTSAGVKAYDRRCPHRGIDLADGYHDAEQIFCPGHGVAFALADGTSKCAALTLRAFDVIERQGQIILGPRKAASTDAVAAFAGAS
ncbi:MAG: Rieske 2Fe-2S domain-containing protein [Betaproteobacteria bacterium]